MVLSLPVYLPLFFSILIFAIGSLKIGKIEEILPLFISMVLVFFFIVSNPNKQVFDMVWISMMLAVLSCVLLSGWLKALSLIEKNELLITLGFTILLVSLSLSIGQFVYAGFNNLAQTNALLGVITSILLLVIAGISTFYFFGKKTMANHLFLSVMFLLLMFQTTAITRIHDFGGNSALEPIFPGEKPDVDTVFAQLESFSYTKEFVEESPAIATVSINNPAIIWGLRDYQVDQFPSHLNPITGYEFLITENEDIETNEPYLGLEFNMDSFPAWTTKPLEHLTTYDFWSWVFTRDAKMIKKSAVVWMKK